MPAIFAFEVGVKNRPNWGMVVNHKSRGKAKSYYYQGLLDAWPDIPFTDLRCRKLGPPQTSLTFKFNAEYRGLPGVKCGDRVNVNGSKGTITGHNSSANFNVLFDDDAPMYAGMTLNVHPQELVLEPPVKCPVNSMEVL